MWQTVAAGWPFKALASCMVYLRDGSGQTAQHTAVLPGWLTRATLQLSGQVEKKLDSLHTPERLGV